MHMKILGITIFSLILAFLLQSENVYAYTYAGGINGDIFTTVNINKYDYAPSEQIHVTTSIYSANPSAVPVDLTATTTSNPVVTVIASQTINPSSTIYGNAYLSAPNSAGSYAVNFVTGVDEVSVIQEYQYESDGGAIYGVCDVPASYYNIVRTSATEQSAAARGVTKVVVEYELTTDNVNGYCTRILRGEFFPGDLSVPANFTDGQPLHNFCSGGSNYCSAFVGADGYNDQIIQEYF